VTFTKPTNRDVATDERSYVDSLFGFEPEIGDDYSGEWLDEPNPKPSSESELKAEA